MPDTMNCFITVLRLVKNKGGKRLIPRVYAKFRLLLYTFGDILCG